MTTINKSQVPQYLQKGSFYESLDPSDEEGFEVPSDCLKADLTVQSDEELRYLLRSLRFWGVYEMPMEIFVYVMKSPMKASDPLLEEFPEFKDHLTKILTVKASKNIVTAITHRLGVVVVRFLQEQMNWALDPTSVNELVAAIRVDDVHSFVYIRDKNKTEYPGMVFLAAAFGSIRFLKHARKEGVAFVPGELDAAVIKGQLECVQFLHGECGVAYTSQSMGCAAEARSLATVRYLHETGCPWEAIISHSFAFSDQLECLMFAHSHGCPWDAKTCCAAAMGGSLRCLEYTHKQGCPWDEKTVLGAVRGDHVDCVTFAVQHGCPVSEVTPYEIVFSLSWRCLWRSMLQRGPCSELLCCLMFWTGILFYSLSYLCETPFMSVGFFIPYTWLHAIDPLGDVLHEKFCLSTEQCDLFRTVNWVLIGLCVFVCVNHAVAHLLLALLWFMYSYLLDDVLELD